MYKPKIIAAISLMIPLASAIATPVSSLQEFKDIFCRAQASTGAIQETVYTLQADIFTKSRQTLTCPGIGDFALNKVEDSNDPGHLLFNIDLIPNNKVAPNTFDCDGKADIGMKIIGLNCYPVNKENSSHKNPVE